MDTPVDARRKVYDDPLPNFTRIADILNGLGFRKKNPNVPGSGVFGAMQSITPVDVAAISIAIKLGRLMYSPWHEDSIRDIAGYSDCWIEIVNPDSDPAFFTPRGPTERKPDESPTPSTFDGPRWVCWVCGVSNPSENEICFNCDRPRYGKD